MLLDLRSLEEQDKLIYPAGIASGEAFGAARSSQSMAPASELLVATGGVTMGGGFLGATVIHSSRRFKIKSGISSGEFFGLPHIGVPIFPNGIPSSEAFGQPQINTRVFANGIASAEAWGTPQVNLVIRAAGVGSLEAFGNPTITISGGTQTILPSGIPSAEAFGNATLLGGAVKIEFGGSASGSPIIMLPPVRKRQVISAKGIPSAERFGRARLFVERSDDELLGLEDTDEALLALV